MKNELFNFFLLRRAAMPMTALLQLHRQCGNNFTKWETALLALFEQPDFSGAIYIASPSLHAAVEQYSFNSPEKARRKILFSIYKYLIRMTTRATPFGLFSVTGTGYFSDQNNVSAASNATNITKRIWLQPEVLSDIAQWLTEQMKSDEQFCYRINNSLYPARNGYRYIERVLAGDQKGENLTELAHSDELELLIDIASKWQSKAQLTSLMAQAIGPNSASMLIKDAIDASVLVGELTYNITGPDFQDRLEGYLDKVQHQSISAKQLLAIMHGLSKNQPLSNLKRIAQQISGVFPITIDRSFVRAQLTMNAKQISLRRASIELLGSEFLAIKGLLQGNGQQQFHFKALKKGFKAHFGLRQVPLCEVIDSSIGARYAGLSAQGSIPASLLEEIEFTVSESAQIAPVTKALIMKQQLIERALRTNESHIEIHDSDLVGLAAEKPVEHGTYWLGELIALSEQQLNDEQFAFHLKAVGGESGLELMARFGQNDPILTAHLLDTANYIISQNLEVIHAEIAHFPDDKAAAVLARPHFWPYEIPYMAYSTLEETKQISVNDILVSLSDQGDFVLTSLRLGRKIIVHNTSAHNYHLGLPIYRLLSDIANQNSQLLRWDWEHLEGFTFLPQVRYRHLILTPAKWNIVGELRQRVLAAITRPSMWQTLKQELKLPRYFQSGHGDNLLLFDSENQFSMELFAAQLQKSDRMQIQQYLQDPDKTLVCNATESYAHELVLAFRPAVGGSHHIVQPPQPGAMQTRLFHLGSRWLYLQIYAETSLLDTILLSAVAPCCEQFTADGLICKWYFIRYFDPGPHIRLRVLLVKSQDWQTVFSDLQRALTNKAANNWIEKIQTASYERELERYAGLRIESVESIFYYDSLSCLKVISAIWHQSQDTARLLAALIGINTLLDDFKLNTGQKQNFTKQTYQDYILEFGQDKTLTRQLDRKYRQLRPLIQQALSGQSEMCSNISAYFIMRSQQIGQLVTVSLPVQEIASYVHMFINRLLENSHREQEMILLYFLSKYYRSQKNTGHSK